MADPTTAAGDISAGDDYECRGKIHQWRRDIDLIEDVPSRSSITGTDLSSETASDEAQLTCRVDGATYTGSNCTTLSRLETDHLLPDDDFDAEDDFLVEAVQRALETGTSAFGVGDYDSSSAYLREALTMIQSLPVEQQALWDTWELRRIFGVCVFHVHDPIQAEAALLRALENAPKNVLLGEKHRLEISEIAHLLAQTYVRKGDLNKAYRYCEYALRGRRRVLGRAHELGYESLALMSRILELQGNALRAQFFTEMIPEEEREKCVARFKDLRASEYDTSLEAVLTDDAQDFSRNNRPALLSHRYSTVSPLSTSGGAIPGDHGQTGTHLSVSSSASDPPTYQRTAVTISADMDRKLSGDVYPQFAVANNQTNSERPVHTQSLSDQASVTVPAANISEAANTQILPAAVLSALGPDVYGSNLAIRTAESTQKSMTDPSNDAVGLGIQEQQVLVRSIQPAEPDVPSYDSANPAFGLQLQPVGTQRKVGLSELPGDTHFTEPDDPVTAIPFTDFIQAASGPPAIPIPPPEYAAHDLPVAEPRPVDAQSISSAQSEPNYNQHKDHGGNVSFHELQPDLLFRRSNTDQQHSRKTSFVKIFRSRSSTSSGDSHSITSSSDGVRLQRSDLDIIKSEPITETIIDFWQEHLEREQIKGSPRYILLRPTRCYFLIDESEVTPALQATLPDFRNTIHVFLPLKSPLRHWSLLLFSARDQVACHYDPDPGKNRALAERVCGRISSFMEKPLSFLEVAETPEQLDAKDSGVFVCFFMQYLIEKLQRTHVSQKTDATLDCKAIKAKDARKEILKIAKSAGGFRG